MDKLAIRNQIEQILIDQFDVERESIKNDASLAEDLGIDSIDAVDLIVRLREITGVNVPPALFKNVRTVGDVERVIVSLVDDTPATASLLSTPEAAAE